MLEGISGVSTYAKDVDEAFLVVTVITLFLFCITIGSMLYFLFKYSSKRYKKEDAKNIKHYTPIEIAWTVIPTILMMIIFYYGLESLRVQRTMPKDDLAINVKVTAQRWFWTFEYENGKKSNELYIPINSDIKLKMTAPKNDVLHAFYVPAFRAKEDIVPGVITKLWFNINKLGKYNIQCAEYCGTRHAYMRSFVNVLSKEDYKTWLEPKKVIKEKSAQDIFGTLGCTGCHSLDGSVLVGPSLKDLYKKKVTIKVNGELKTVVRDELYLKRAILEPNKEIVDGFIANMMPSFKNVISDEDLKILLRYLKNEKIPVKEKILDGKLLLETKGCLACHSLDGSKIVGPTLKALYNKENLVLEDGTLKKIIAKEEYIKESILYPNKKVVKDYPANMMPSFKDQLTKEELNAIIDYLKNAE